MGVIRQSVVTISIASLVFGIYAVWQSGGVWCLTFENNSSAVRLGIENPDVIADESTIYLLFNPQDGLNFDTERIEVKSHHVTVPYGEVTFVDVTMLPGRITLEIDGRNIDIMKSALHIDGEHHVWGENAVIDLRMTTD